MTVIVYRVGRLRGEAPGWAVMLTTERKRFGGVARTEAQFVKVDSERFWEDEDGWYLEPGSKHAELCDAVVKKFTPWSIETGQKDAE